MGTLDFEMNAILGRPPRKMSIFSILDRNVVSTSPRLPGGHQQAPGTRLRSAVVTLCHFLHIWAGPAFLTGPSGRDRRRYYAGLQINPIISANEIANESDPGRICFCRNRVIGFKFNQKGQ
jgi:hypothetical protein